MQSQPKNLLFSGKVIESLIVTTGDLSSGTKKNSSIAATISANIIKTELAFLYLCGIKGLTVREVFPPHIFKKNLWMIASVTI